LKEVESLEVLKTFDKYNKISEGNTNHWARELVTTANKKFNGQWHLAELTKEDALKILLPWHNHGEKVNLVPKTGMTVQAAANYFKKNATEYKKENPKCHAKIIMFSEKEITEPLFLSTAPLTGCDKIEHEKLHYTDKSLVHLDGLHRLIAWAINDKFSNSKIKVFICGPLL